MRTVLILFTLLLVSCIKNEPDVVLINRSDIDYDSALIFVSEANQTVLRNVKIDSRHAGSIRFDTTVIGDGCYQLEVYNKGELKHQKCFGYYTNGASLNRSFEIEIQKDSVLVQMN
ncbi:hypothetical protein QYS48_31635 [Marivirga arenosa]|uniref:Lipoprotein n=1 Tax=Marivirga arenosa TaxID=3059076 RepID=A0AA51R5X6_9BACT|nr:hypothetical protein [Marivirga sp. ABR2-2]WMN06112.1 hypothetical protein QYS48_31635 [Marivirga sp. ABR2-2]